MKPLDWLMPMPNACLFCGKLFVPLQLHLCEDCVKALGYTPGRRSFSLPNGGQGWAPFEYRDSPRQCLHAMKLRGETWRAAWMAEWMTWTAMNCFFDLPSVLVPVPIHPLRALGRGYAQCALLGKPMARALEMEYVSKALRRTGYARPRYRTDAGRHPSARGLFSLGREGERVRGRSVLLIDDLVTTGATLSECGQLLLSAGATRVEYICYAAVPHSARAERF